MNHLADTLTGPPGEESYEPPALVPIGNLHDLLAQGGSAQCDGADNLTPGVGTDNLCL